MVASLGAVPPALMEITRFSRALYTSTKASPPNPVMEGSVTARTAKAATAASKALPPDRKIASPTCVACGLRVEMACRLPRTTGRRVRTEGGSGTSFIVGLLILLFCTPAEGLDVPRESVDKAFRVTDAQ